MQANLRTLRTVVAVLIASLMLAACSGDNGNGSTWFNLPSIPVTVQDNGSVSVMGFDNVAALQPATIDQLRAANVQQLEIRVGYHGIFLFANGEALPYIAWNSQIVDTLQAVLRDAPDNLIPNGDEIATVLPWLRRVGVGATVDVPLAEGAEALDIPRWQGETPVVAQAVDTPTIGPFQFGGIAFDEQGNMTLAGVPLSELGVGPLLPADTLQVLNSVGAEQLSVATEPDGLALSLNGRPLPKLAYDEARLQRAVSLLQPFIQDEALITTLNDVMPRLPGADISATVSLTGEAEGGIQLASLPAQLQSDGSLAVYGVPTGGGSVVPADVVANLQEAGVEQLYVNLVTDNLYLAVNGEPLPVISWSEDTLGTVENVVGTLLDVEQGTLSGAIQLVRSLTEQTPVGLSIAMPDFEGEPATFDVEQFAIQPPDEPVQASDSAVQTGVVLDNGSIQSVAGLPASSLEGLGVALPALPDDIAGVLNSLDADQIQLVGTGGNLALHAGDRNLLTISYDEASLDRMLGLVGSLTGDTSLVSQVESFLPLLTEREVNVVIALSGGDVPPTNLAAVPRSLTETGGLTVYGQDLGLGSIVPAMVVDLLQQANIQRLDARIADNSLYLAANGQRLPVVRWTDESQSLIQDLVVSLAGMSPDFVAGIFDLLENTDAVVDLSVPSAEGAEAVSVPEDFNVVDAGIEPVDLGDTMAPMLSAAVSIEDGQITAVGDLSASELADMGVPLPPLPPEAVQTLNSLGVSEVTLATMPDGLALTGDGQTLLQLSYDSEVLLDTITVARPLLPADVVSQLGLDDPDATTALQENVLPLIIGSDITLSAMLQ